MNKVTPRNAAETEILEFIQTRLRFTNQDVAEHCKASDWVRTNFLNTLRHNGFVTVCGMEGNTKIFTAHSPRETQTVVTSSKGKDLGAAAYQTKLSELMGKMHGTDAAGASAELSEIGPFNEDEQAIWDFVSGRDYFTFADAAAVCPVESVRRRFFKRLRQSGVLRDCGRRLGVRLMTVRKTVEIRENAKDMRSTKDGAIWSAIRQMRRFRPVDLYAALSPARSDISQKDILDYCRTLRLAGYLRTSARTRVLKNETPLSLMKNTGPLPPQKRSMTVVIDTNDDKIVYAPGGRLE